LFFFIGIASSGALEYQGQIITAQDIQNLPPGTIENLSPDAVKQVKNLVSGQDQAGQGNSISNSTDASNNKTTDDTASDSEYDRKKITNGVSGKSSIIEQQYRKGYSSSFSSRLNQFGYDIFSSARMQASSLAVPDPEYLLGTGDQLLIRLWGSNIDAEYSGTINREGALNVPKVGIIQLAGVTYGDAETIILKEAKKYIQGINISVTLTKLRSLEIYVVGAVRNPGLHIVPSFSTIFDGLLAAGGVKKSGTLRQIKLNRSKKTDKGFRRL